MRLPVRAFLFASAAALAACSASPEEDASDQGSRATADESAPKLCAAVRGNGHYIVTHFASLARIIEHHGIVDGIAGGSSASITSLVYESILQNESITKCGGKDCGDKLPARVALALKSLQGYGETLTKSDEGIAIGNLVGLGGRLQKDVADRNIEGLAKTDPNAAAASLRDLLANEDIADLINPEVPKLLADPAHLEFNVNETLTAIKTLGAFSADENRLFFRTGILNWDHLALLFGRVADFYATKAAPKEMGDWLTACADGSVGKPWEAVATLPGPKGKTCGAAFDAMASAYRASVKDSKTAPARLGQRVGAPSPLRKVISTSVLEGKAIAAYDKARAAYVSGAHPTGNIPFDIDFDDVSFGYWGSEDDLGLLQLARVKAGDLKSSKMTSLGNATWKEVLTASPAEPGLSRFVSLPDRRLSAGGWSDLAPTLALKNMGCERVVYVTREGDESFFATKIAKHLGMDEAAWKELYDLGNAESSLSRSIASADGVWCTKWDSFKDFEQPQMALEAFGATFESRSGFEGVRTSKAYPNTVARAGKAGCTPGVSGGAKFPQ